MKNYFSLLCLIMLCGCGGNSNSTNTPSFMTSSINPSISTASSISELSSSANNSSVVSLGSINSSTTVSSRSFSSQSNSQASSQSNSNGFVSIPDPLVKAAVLQELNLNNNATLTPVQMQTLISLQISGAPTTLAGLETATNLTFLDISNSLSSKPALNLNPLGNLLKLESLYLNGFTLNDLSPIQSLIQIDDLDLSNSRFTSLDNIAGFSKLTTLWLNDTQLSALPAFVANFTKLEWISLSENPLDNNDISALNNLPIRRLSIDYTGINNLSFLANKNLLRSLNITGTPVYDLTPLLTSGLTSGSSLTANYSCIHIGKYSENTSIINQLKIRGVSVFNAFQNPGIYGDPDKTCANQLQNLNANFIANYNNGSLSLNWSFTNVDNKLTCEVYIDLQGQQPRSPVAVIDNCQSKTSDSKSTNFTNAPVQVLVWDEFGSKKLFSANVTNETQTDIYLHSYDWGQTIVKNDLKLIPDKSALLRLHFIAPVANTPAPDIQVQAVLNAVQTNLTVTKPAEVSTTKSFYAFDRAYKIQIDKTLMKPGLTIKITFGSTEKTLTPVFGKANELNITLVPIKILNTTGQIPNHNSIKNAFLQLWPLSNVNLVNRQIYTSSATRAEDMENVLYEIEELHLVDGDNSHYYGLFSNNVYQLLNFNDFGGIAFIGATTGIGSDQDSDFSIMLHELGHNFNLAHINCGGPTNFDLLYPYSSNSIGSLGINSAFTNLFSPNSFRDIMGYCSPDFVSDYSYEKAQDYLEAKPSQAFKSVSAQKTTSGIERSWFISGTLGRNAVAINNNPVELRRILPINKKSTLHYTGRYQLNLTDFSGTIYSQTFDTKVMDHSGESTREFFSLLIPQVDIAKIEIYEGNKLLFNQSAPEIKETASLQKTQWTQPIVTKVQQQVCLHWNNQQFDSASLILNQNDGQLTLFMDSKLNDPCVDFDFAAQGSEWKIILRKGLLVKEFTQSYP
jgi:hypothetical protein